MNTRLKTLLFGALAAPLSTAWTAERLDTEAIARFGGSYALECANPASPRLRVLDDGLLAERGKQRVTGREPQASYSFFGPTPPKNFQVALLSQVGGKSELNFYVSRDRRGNYIEIDGTPDVKAMLAPSMIGKPFRQCEGAAMSAAATAAAAPSKPAQPPAAPSAAHAPDALPDHPSDMLKDRAYRKAWRAALGSRAREPWLVDMNGPAPEPRWVGVAGGRYVYGAFCKPHDCYDNNAVQLYGPDDGRMYAFIHSAGSDAFVGAPPPAFAAELRRLWQSEWRAASK